MSLKTLWFISVLCAAIVAGLTLAHDLEIPGKSALSGAEWLRMQQTFYGGFAILGGLSEVIGLISSGILAYLLRAHRPAFILALIATGCFAGTLLIFAVGNNPLNQQVAQWTPQTLPPNWQATRDAWDRFHAASSVFAVIALVTLLVSIVRDTTLISTTSASRK